MNELTTATAVANAVETVRTPEIVAAEIRALTASMLNNVIEIGRRLTEAKEMLPHGEFGSWVTEQTAYSLSTANNFMRLYQEYGEDQGNLFGTGAKSQTIGNLPYSKALALLALPAGEREEFVETPHTVDGEEKTVEEMSTRELRQAIKERDEAVAAQEKMAADMKFANERIEGLNADLETKAAEAEKAREDAERLTAELKTLREKPMEVAVQEKVVPDKKAIDAAVKKAKDEAEEKRKSLEEKLDKARAAQTAAEAERDALRAQLDAAREQAKKAAGSAALSADAELAQFKLLFESIQTDINKLTGLLMKVRLRDAEAAGKLTAALNALADKIKEGARE